MEKVDVETTTKCQMYNSSFLSNHSVVGLHISCVTNAISHWLESEQFVLRS